MTEQEIIEQFEQAKQAYEKAAREVELHFYPLAIQLLRDGNVSAAGDVLLRCPDSVTAAFIADAINDYKKGRDR